MKKHFTFGDKKSDKLNLKVNLKEIEARARQWEHPVYGLFRVNEEINKNSGDILKTSKRTREVYALSILAMAMQDNYKHYWWINISETDAADGLIMSLQEIIGIGAKGLVREVQIVEHRYGDKDIYDTIFEKVSNTAYMPETILLCLVLCNQVVNLELLSQRLSCTKSSFDDIFLVFAGISTSEFMSTDQINHTYSLVQLIPTFISTSFDYRSILTDFIDKYKKGQEILCIENSKIIFYTRNKKFLNNL